MVKRLAARHCHVRLTAPVLCGVLALAGALVPSVAASARRAPAVVTQAGSPAAQPPPSDEARRLDAALARVNRSPHDIDTLIEAAAAASGTGDDEAAIGFFRRAALIAPADARVLTGLAHALVWTNDPVGALLLYDRAERSAPLAPPAIGDRGLAYDLVGDNARAQRAYRQSLTLMESPEITRRLALSQAIAGDGRAAEATLRPLLQDQDKGGWRTRAFIFAITGQVDEAVTVAKTLLPGDLAAAITPYLRYMPRLTRAQQAAAATLGAFPVASAIGRDDSRIARYGGGSGLGALTSADLPLAPAGAPLGRHAPAPAQAPTTRNDGGLRVVTRSERAAETAMRVAPPEPPPARRITSPAAPPGDQPRSPPATLVLSLAQGPVPLAAGQVPQLAAIADGAAVRQPPAPTARRPSLADAFGDLGSPDMPATPRADAVDISRLEAVVPAASATGKPPAPRSPVPKPAVAKPAKVDRTPPSHPSRIWVQLGVGRDHQAMAADWRRMARQTAKVLGGRQPFVSENGARDRMLTGPFESEAAAHAFVGQLDAAGLSGPYVWISPAGQVVDALNAR